MKQRWLGIRGLRGSTSISLFTIFLDLLFGIWCAALRCCDIFWDWGDYVSLCWMFHQSVPSICQPCELFGCWAEAVAIYICVQWGRLIKSRPHCWPDVLSDAFFRMCWIESADCVIEFDEDFLWWQSGFEFSHCCHYFFLGTVWYCLFFQDCP